MTDALLEKGRLAGVVTADGREHRAEHVVLATGAWSGAAAWLPPEARPPVRPVKGQILTLRREPRTARVHANRRHGARLSRPPP